MSGRKKPSVVAWIFFALFVAHGIGFLVNSYNDEVSGMVRNGFMGLMWFYLADRERDA